MVFINSASLMGGNSEISNIQNRFEQEKIIYELERPSVRKENFLT